MNSKTIVKRPSAFLPLAMSFAPLATILIFIASNGTQPQTDEGAAAHIWQLLMAAQLPLIAYFAIRWVPQSPRKAVPILVLQLGAALAAMAPVFLLRWCPPACPDLLASVRIALLPSNAALRHVEIVLSQDCLREFETHRFERIDNPAGLELAGQAHEHPCVVERDTGRVSQELSHVVGGAAGSLVQGGSGKDGRHHLTGLHKRRRQAGQVHYVRLEAHRAGRAS